MSQPEPGGIGVGEQRHCQLFPHVPTAKQQVSGGNEQRAVNSDHYERMRPAKLPVIYQQRIGRLATKLNQLTRIAA